MFLMYWSSYLLVLSRHLRFWCKLFHCNATSLSLVESCRYQHWAHFLTPSKHRFTSVCVCDGSTCPLDSHCFFLAWQSYFNFYKLWVVIWTRQSSKTLKEEEEGGGLMCQERERSSDYPSAQLAWHFYILYKTGLNKFVCILKFFQHTNVSILLLIDVWQTFSILALVSVSSG